MAGSPDELGLPQLLNVKQIHVEVYTDMFLSGPPGHAVPVSDGNSTIEQVQDMLKATGGYMCEFPLRHPDKWEYVPPDSFWPGVKEHEYPRHVPHTCPPLTLYPGDALTLVSFYDPPEDQSLVDVPMSGIMTGQHGMLEGFQINGDCDKDILAQKVAEQDLKKKLPQDFFHKW
ncbi:MAG: hypothetical protein SGPRY_003594 [Prymnesium sp.]